MTHLGVGFLVPAVSPSPATWSFSGPADLTLHHLGRQPRAPSCREVQGGRSWASASLRHDPRLPASVVLLILLPSPGDPLPASPVHPPRTTSSGEPCPVAPGDLPLLLSSTCLFTQPSGAHFLAKAAEKCYNGAVDENMLEAYGRETVTPTRGGVQGGFLEEGHWHLGCEGGIGVQCREKDEKALQAKKRGYTGADCRSFL